MTTVRVDLPACIRSKPSLILPSVYQSTIFGTLVRRGRRVEVDTHDHVGAGHPRALHHVEADAAQAVHDDVGAGLDLGRVDHGADAGGDPAADVADLVERRVLADLRDGDLRQDGEVGEGRAAHAVVDVVPLPDPRRSA